MTGGYDMRAKAAAADAVRLVPRYPDDQLKPCGHRLDCGEHKIGTYPDGRQRYACAACRREIALKSLHKRNRERAE